MKSKNANVFFFQKKLKKIQKLNLFCCCANMKMTIWRSRNVDCHCTPLAVATSSSALAKIGRRGDFLQLVCNFDFERRRCVVLVEQARIDDRQNAAFELFPPLSIRVAENKESDRIVQKRLAKISQFPNNKFGTSFSLLKQTIDH